MDLKLLRTSLVFSVLLLAACASHEGLYEPACVAYSGHRITLENGRFEWRRFTDQRVVGDDGKLVDPFPGFPKTGTYSRTGSRLTLQTDEGSRLDSWFFAERDGKTYLLTETQNDAVLAGKMMPRCALVLVSAGS